MRSGMEEERKAAGSNEFSSKLKIPLAINLNLFIQHLIQAIVTRAQNQNGYISHQIMRS